MRDVRASIIAGAFPAFVRQFIKGIHEDGNVPQWARQALAYAGIELE